MLTIERLVKTFAPEKRKRRQSDGELRTPARVRAVDDLSLDVREGEMFTLLGPSGCGKTTTLRSVAGLERPDSGKIQVNDRVLFAKGESKHHVHVPVNQRGLGMVFQSYAIWPHMKVFENVAFPLKVQSRRERPSRKEIRRRVMGVLETMELEAFADRPATKLSGGQQQRLALARALVTEPPLMLLDEPLSNLDAKLRDSLRFELKRLQRELGITSVYVTHDQIEALALSSRIAVMCDGVIMQVGKPREIYQRPANKFVAEFIGTTNFIEGKVWSCQSGTLEVDTKHGRLRVAAEKVLKAGDDVALTVRPESIVLSEAEPTGNAPNELRGVVATRNFLGDAVDHLVTVDEEEVRVRANPSTSIPQNTEVTLTIAPEALVVVPLEV